MAVRTFTDASGTRWQAWAVMPTLADRRSGRDRRAADGADAPDERRRGPERRIRDLGRRAGVAAPLIGGWLCFAASAHDGAALRRRLAPIPAGWEECSEAALNVHLAHAMVPTGAGDAARRAPSHDAGPAAV